MAILHCYFPRVEVIYAQREVYLKLVCALHQTLPETVGLAGYIRLHRLNPNPRESVGTVFARPDIANTECFVTRTDFKDFVYAVFLWQLSNVQLTEFAPRYLDRLLVENLPPVGFLTC